MRVVEDEKKPGRMKVGLSIKNVSQVYINAMPMSVLDSNYIVHSDN